MKCTLKRDLLAATLILALSSSFSSSSEKYVGKMMLHNINYIYNFKRKMHQYAFNDKNDELFVFLFSHSMKTKNNITNTNVFSSENDVFTLRIL